MIFCEEHIEKILNGEKTQTRRVHRGKYQKGRSYSIQKCRTCKGIEGYGIVMDKIWEEKAKEFLINVQGSKYPSEIHISKEDAWAEGGYTPARFERVFRELNPKWGGWARWVFEFHVIEVRK